MSTLPVKRTAHWVGSGAPWIWLNAGALAISLMAVVGLIGYIFLKGIVHFWPHPILQAEIVLERAVDGFWRHEARPRLRCL